MMAEGRNSSLPNSWSYNERNLLNEPGFSFFWNHGRVSETNVNPIIIEKKRKKEKKMKISTYNNGYLN